MNRILSTLAIITALAGPVAAQEVQTHVDIAGKDDQTIQADIHKAAEKVCRETFIGDHEAQLEQTPACVSKAESDAMNQVGAIKQAQLNYQRTTLAALSPTTASPGR